MGWVWKDDDDDSNSRSVTDFHGSPSGADTDRTRRIVRSNCKTEEIEPGKFIRKCDKTEELLKDCVGRPTEVVQSLKEYTEDDVTDEVMRGSSSSTSILGSSEIQPFEFPGLRSDIEAIERGLFGGLSHFFDRAEEVRSELFRAFDDVPFFGRESSWSPSPKSKEIPIEDFVQKEHTLKGDDSGSGKVDLSGLARDV